MLWLVRVSSLLQPMPVHIHQTSDDLRIIDKWHISWLVDNTRTDRQDLIIIISWPVQLHKIYLTSDIHTDRQTYIIKIISWPLRQLCVSRWHISSQWSCCGRAHSPSPPSPPDCLFYQIFSSCLKITSHCTQHNPHNRGLRIWGWNNVALLRSLKFSVYLRKKQVLWKFIK